MGTSDLLDPVAALLTIQGAAGNNTLNISDAADQSNNTGVLSATTLRGFGMNSGIDYFDIETLNFTLGTGSDTLTVLSTHVRNTNINASTGDDSIWIQTSDGTTVINGDAGEDLVVTQATIAGVLNVFGGDDNDAFWISSNGPAANGVLPTITGQLTFDGQAGDDSLFADNAGDTNANDFLIETALLTFAGFGNANYVNLETLTVNSGSNADTITVATTHTGETNVNSNAGADTVHVQTVAGATM